MRESHSVLSWLLFFQIVRDFYTKDRRAGSTSAHLLVVHLRSNTRQACSLVTLAPLSIKTRLITRSCLTYRRIAIGLFAPIADQGRAINSIAKVNISQINISNHSASTSLRTYTAHAYTRCNRETRMTYVCGIFSKPYNKQTPLKDPPFPCLGTT